MAVIPGDSPVVTRAAVMKMRQRVVMKPHMGSIVIQKWPRKRGKTKSTLQQAWIDRFSILGCFLKNPDSSTLDQAKDWAKGSGWFWRDVLTAAANGNLLIIPGEVKVTTPTFYLDRFTPIAVLANVYKPIPFEAAIWDNNVFWAASPTPSRVVVRAPGLYLIGGTLLYTATATDANRYARFKVNDDVNLPLVSLQDIANQPIAIQWSTIWYFHQDDYVELLANSTNNVTVSASTMWGVAITPEALL